MRVVVVDDNEILCDNLRILFESEGFDVVTFTDPRHALGYCICNVVHVLVSDVRMPSMDGLDFVRLVREAQPSVRTIIVSGHYDDDEEVGRAVMRHVADVAFAKPFSLAALMRSLLTLAGDCTECAALA